MAVYFVAAGPYVKIGYSADPIGRSATVTMAGKRPADLPRATETRILGWIPGDRRAEADMHAHFGDDHVDGEWFYVDNETARRVIWEDPAGVDLERMTALAVFAADQYPGITREQIAAAGIQVEASPGPCVVDMSWLGGAA